MGYEWITVEERMPKDRQVCWGVTKVKHGYVYLLQYDGEQFRDVTDNDIHNAIDGVNFIAGIICWQPLITPDPPEPDNG
jgi:hypothetical protein